MKMPAFPQEVLKLDVSCSLEEGRGDREAMRRFRDEARRCHDLRTQRGLEKVMALKGRGRKE